MIHVCELSCEFQHFLVPILDQVSPLNYSNRICSNIDSGEEGNGANRERRKIRVDF